MFDPNPVVGLPEVEYIELYNSSDLPMLTKGYFLSDPKTMVALDSFYLPGKSYLLICGKDDFELFDATYKLALSKWPSLNNGGDSIRLWFDSLLLEEIPYEVSWLKDKRKEEGGWSLERIDPNLTCGSTNWEASKSVNGGTPGDQNSVMAILEDHESPKLVKAFPIDSFTYSVHFDEPVESLKSKDVYSVEFLQEEVQLKFEDWIGHAVKQIQLDDVLDCHDNKLEVQLDVVYPKRIIPEGAIKVNEVLFNPYSYGSDYVELYNQSNDAFFWSDLYFDFGQKVVKPIGDNESIFWPKTYQVFTEDRSNVLENYPINDSLQIIEISDLPTLPDSNGSIIVLNRQYEVIDSLMYQDSMHFGELVGEDGIALERLSLHEETNDPFNWFSASHSVAYGTPGLKNSQTINLENCEDYVDLGDAYLSPNNDGVNDFLSIELNLPFPDYLGSVMIYDLNGQIIDEIVNHQFIGNGGLYYWDGGQADEGTYVVKVEVSRSNQRSIIIKKAIALVLENTL